jgi:hypothetical protein
MRTFKNIFKIVGTQALAIIVIFALVLQPVSAGVGDTPGAAPSSAATRNLQTAPTDPKTEDPSNSAFRISVCDGPTIPPNQPEVLAKAQADLDHTYVACDFNAVILLVQHLINIMLVVGVLAAIVMFAYAGLLFISGQKPKIDKARSIFPKVFVGFIIMLSAWFIVFQILSWLTDNNGFKTLLGS